jgi:tryptophan synthase alpha chain
MLETYIKDRKANRDLLLMTHIVVGYPSLAASLELVDAMVEAGVDLMELQIPFSEPVADGPVILRANQLALANHIRTDDCFAFAETVSKKHDIPFLFMGYYNALYVRGIQRFVRDMRAVGVRGAIVADLPHEEATEYLDAMQENGLDPVFIFSPNSPLARMQAIASVSRGFVYCVARKGVTGKNTEFSEELGEYFARCRKATSLPLALGFGVRGRSDIDFLRGKVDVAVVGSETLRVLDAHGIGAVTPFLRNLVAPTA